MPVTRAHESSVVQIFTDLIDPAVVLGGITDYGGAANTDIAGGATSGKLYSEHESVSAQRPELTFSLEGSLATTLATVGVIGVPLTAGNNLGLAAYFKKRDSGGSYEAGASHRRYRIYDGILVPQSLRATFQQNAQLSLLAAAIYDGNNNPLAEQDAQTIPAGGVCDEFYTLYDVDIAGVALPQSTAVEIDFGNQIVRDEGATGNSNELIWPTHIALNAVEPTLTITGIDLEWIKSTNIPLLGKAGTHANSTIKLIRRLHGSTFYDIAESQHITISVAGLIVPNDLFTASNKDTATCTLQMRTVFDGTNTPLVITTGATL